MTEIFKRTQNAYDKIVLDYASRNHDNMPANLAFMAEALVRQIGPGRRVLDAGCGTGRNMSHFEAQGVNITGIDLSMGMLEYARQWVRGPLCQANMVQLPFPGGTFDGIWCCTCPGRQPCNR